MNSETRADYNLSLFGILEKTAKKQPDNICFRYNNENGQTIEIPYKAFYREAKLLSASLYSKFGKNKIALCLKNGYYWALSYYAVCCHGGIIVPLDYEMPLQETAKILRFSEARAIITDERTAGLLKEYITNIKIYIFHHDKASDDLKALSLNGKLLTEASDSYICRTAREELSVLLFTSGTGAEPKGVMLSEKNICSDILSITALFDFSSKDSTHCILPLHHAYQSIVLHTIISVGGCFSFSRGLRYLGSELQSFCPTIFVCVPLILEKIHTKIITTINNKYPITKGKAFSKYLHLLNKLNSKELSKILFKEIRNFFGGQIKYIITGAAALSAETENDLTTFGLKIFNGYGLTECSPIIICNNPSENRSGSIGKPVYSAEAKIYSPNSDGIGEIYVKGPMVMLGYYKDEKSTTEAFTNGWFATGDLGYKDSEGFYYIAGRKKNVIVTKNGKNIYPEELEALLCASPFIREAFVFSRDGENENVMATVIADEESIAAHLKNKNPCYNEIHTVIDSVIRKTNKRLPSYKAIKKFILRKEPFDKTSTHKIKRYSPDNKKGSG